MVDDHGIGDSFTQILALQQRLRRQMQDALGVDSAGLSTMIHLASVGTDSPTAIAAALQTSTAATSLVLNRLEVAGHISRQPHAKDRRKIVVQRADSVACIRSRSATDDWNTDIDAGDVRSTPERLRGLRRWNTGLVVLHLVQAAAVLFLTNDSRFRCWRRTSTDLQELAREGARRRSCPRRCST